MKIGILCAGDEELAPFLPLISNCKITEKAIRRTRPIFALDKQL